MNHHDGFVNRQNCCFWGSENPLVFAEKQMHSQWVTVWSAFWAADIIGLYSAGQAVTVTAHDNPVPFAIWNLMILMSLQQDVATCQTAREALQWLRETYPDRILSPFSWLELTPE